MLRWTPFALLLAFQSVTLDDFYKFKAGTTWTYKRMENGVERKIMAKSLGEESGQVRLEWLEFEKDGSLHKSSEITWWVQDGILKAEAKEKDSEARLTFSILKEGAKKDDTWSSQLGEMTHQGAVDVTVPAGTYKGAVQTRLGIEGDVRIDFYLASKVGFVKISLAEQGQETQLWELTEFKPAK